MRLSGWLAVGVSVFISGAIWNAAGQPANLVYQARKGGLYKEGLRSRPSTNTSLDLVAALIERGEPERNLPASMRALFYVPDTRRVSLTIREIKPQHFYWLDEVTPVGGWKVGQANDFVWSTETVLKQLKPPMDPAQLGAAARLDSSSTVAERIVPVALGVANLPGAISGYHFVFYPTATVRLQFDIASESSPARPVADSQKFPRVVAGEPHSVRWKAVGWSQGWYKMTITGYNLATNERLDKTVSFYHAARLGK